MIGGSVFGAVGQAPAVPHAFDATEPMTLPMPGPERIALPYIGEVDIDAVHRRYAAQAREGRIRVDEDSRSFLARLLREEVQRRLETHLEPLRERVAQARAELEEATDFILDLYQAGELKGPKAGEAVAIPLRTATQLIEDLAAILNQERA